MDAELRRLRHALDTMPDRERRVFERARFDGQDYPTIAAALHLSVDDVERLLAAAMLHMLSAAE